VVQEKYPVKQMTSASYGLPNSYSLGYDARIPLAVRISNGGEFVHSAPWSVADQGHRNVSHGCVNINPTAAGWFYRTFGYGDIVDIRNTGVRLPPTDGFGDWNIPWADWLKGSALR
jgi:lipoprotein-anchoring transpeptidase ErfK/SrfK